jgi:hypothetical protein
MRPATSTAPPVEPQPVVPTPDHPGPLDPDLPPDPFTEPDPSPTPEPAPARVPTQTQSPIPPDLGHHSGRCHRLGPRLGIRRPGGSQALDPEAGVTLPRRRDRKAGGGDDGEAVEQLGTGLAPGVAIHCGRRW